MASYYKCPDCTTFLAPNWALLKGHMIRMHNRDDLKGEQVKEDAFADYQITEEEYNTLKQPPLNPQSNTGAENATQNPDAKTPPLNPTPKTTGDTPANNAAPNPPPEEFYQYTGEPVERMRQVLLVNGLNPGTVAIITKVMNLSPWLWGNPYELETMLNAHIANAKPKGWVQQSVAQYIRGVDLPNEVKGMSGYNYGPQNPYGQPGYQYPFPNQPQPAQFGPPVPNPELAEMRAEVTRLREERQKEHEKQYEDRIRELEKKLEAGTQQNPLLEKIKELENKLANAGQNPMMIINDEQGHPMQVPYDRGFMAALTRKQEVEMESMRTEQMLRIMTMNSGGSDKTEEMLAELKKDREDSNKQIAELTKQLRDQQLNEMKAEIKAVREMAINPGTDGKGVLDVATEAGDNLKEGAMAIAREVKESVDSGLNKIGEILTNRPAAPVNAVSRSPQEISAIMETENELLNLLPGA
jgi:DNA-binding transcriptional MerR regulator